MKKYLFIIFLSLSSSLYGQDISLETQKYYVLANEGELDYSTYGIHNVKYFRKDSRPIRNKNRYLIYYANVMAKDTCEFNRIMDNVIVTPRYSNPNPQ